MGAGGATCIVAITMSIRRFWRADHSKRWHYTIFGSVVICFLAVLIVVGVLALPAQQTQCT